MNEISSKYTKDITSTTTRVDVQSTTHSNLSWKSEFSPLSVARQAPGADRIASMAGIFSACKVGDNWKEEKQYDL